MDILAARKKAAERAQAEKQKEEPSAPVEQQPVPAAPERAKAEEAVPSPAVPAEPAAQVDDGPRAPMAAEPLRLRLPGTCARDEPASGTACC